MATIGSILIDGQDPDMPALRAFLANLDGRVGGALTQLLAAFVANQAVVVYPARSSLYGNLAPADRALGIVYNDGSNNGLYIKSGVAGSGSWSATGLMLRGEQGEDGPQGKRGTDGKSFLQTAIDTGYVPAGTTEAQLNDKIVGQITATAVAARDKAQEWAEGSGAPGGGQSKSSRGWAFDAANLSTAAGIGKTGAETAAAAAGQYRQGIQDAVAGLPTAATLPLQAVSRTIMAGFTGQNAGRQAFLSETGRAGPWEWLAGDQSALVTGDPDQAFCVAPTATPNGSAGAWRRIGILTGLPGSGLALATWAGVMAGGTADQAAKINRLLALPGVTSVELPAGIIMTDRAIMLKSGQRLFGQGVGATTIKALPGTVSGQTDPANPNANALIYGRRGAVGVRVHDLYLDGSKVGNHYLNGVTMFGCIDFVVERVWSKDISGYARWAVGDTLNSCSGVFRDQMSLNANVDYEATVADGVLFERCDWRDGDGDIIREAGYHPYSSSNITFRDCRGFGTSSVGVLTANYSATPMTNIVFENVKVRVPASVAFAATSFQSSISKVRLINCDIASDGYIGVNVSKDGGLGVDIEIIGGTVSGVQEGITIGAGNTFAIRQPRITVTRQSAGAYCVPLNIDSAAVGTIDAPVIDLLGHKLVTFKSSANNRVINAPIYVDTSIEQLPIGPGHRLSYLTTSPSKAYDNGGDVVPGTILNGLQPGVYLVTLEGSYKASAVGIGAKIRLQATGTTKLLTGRGEVGSQAAGAAANGPMDNANNYAVGTGVDVANASRDFRAQARLSITSVDCGLFVYATSSGNGTIAIEAGSIMTVERVA